MKYLWTITWALALVLLLAQAGAAQDSSGVVGWEVFSTSTPGGGGTMESQGLTGERTAWFITHVAPGNAGVVNMVVTYYDSKESLDKAKEKEKEKNKKVKKSDGKKSDPPSVPTFDPRFYEYKDGKVIPKTQNSSESRAATNSNGQIASVEGLVVPDNIHDRQPFSFAAPQIAGEAATIQTIDGEVVQATSADRYGRIFLAAGLPMGAYMVSSSGRSIGQVEIKQRVGDALQHVSQTVELNNPPQALKLSNPFSLSGQGFNPNCAEMRVGLNGAGQTESPIVLAATEDQLKLAPVQQLRPGTAQLRVTNRATGDSTEPYNVLIYDIRAELKRQNIHSHGDQTELVVTAEPEDQPLTVKVNVASGPVDFGHGRKQAEAITNNGQAIFPVHAERGSGPFQLTWELASIPEGYLQVAYHPSSTGNGGNGLPGTTSADSDRGGFADDSGRKTKDKDDTHSPSVPLHTKRCEWRFLRVEKTIYTQDNKELAEAKEKLGKALLDLIGKAAPTAGKVTKAALSALSISRANNVYLVYILVEIVDGAESVIDTKIVGPLEDKDAMDFWSDSKADDGTRQNTIARNKPTGGCPKK